MRLATAACVGILVWWLATIERVALAAAPIKINGPLVAGGSVFESQFSPNSSRVLYRADQTADGLFEIYAVPSTGGTAVKLNGTLVAGGDVLAAQFGPDSSRVLYHADQSANDVFEIYSVPSGGGTPTTLNNPLVLGGDVSFPGFHFSPNSSRVLYHADQAVDEVFEIFSVPSAGGTVTKLNGSLVAGGDVNSNGFQFSPDSSRVLYQADQAVDEVFEIFSVPSGGGTAVKLNGPLAAGGDVISQQFSPDSSRVLYRADQTTNDVSEIFSVSSAGGPVVKLNGPLVAGGQVNSDSLQFSPDSSRVLYQADQTTDGVLEIFSVPSGGGTAVKLNGPLVLGGDVDEQQFSPDSSRVVYDADQTTDDVVELFSVPATGGTAVKLNGPMISGGDVSGFYSFSPDSSRVVYMADQVTNDVSELFSVPGTGGAAVKLNGPLVAGGDVSSSGVQFSSDSSRVLYMADQNTDEVVEIFIVPTTGGTAVKLNGSLVPGGDVSDVQFSPDSSLVLYLADQDADEVVETYVRIVRQHSRTGAGNWDAGAAWDHGGEPDDVMQVFVDGAGTVTATGTGARTVNELVIGGGAGNSTLVLADGAGISSLHGASIRNGGVLRGDGTLVADLVVDAGGEIRAGAGDRLALSSTTLANAGRIEAIGTGFSPAEIEFDGAVSNSAGTGNIVARNAVLRFHGGLTNNSMLAVSFGTTDVLGDVSNSATATIAVAGNSNVTFYDDMTNTGTLNVNTGSTAVFFGALAGNGNVGGGNVQALGDLLPGASPDTMSFGGNLVLGALTNLEVELAGLAAGSQYDQVHVTGQFSLDGTLEVVLIDDFTPSAGDSFDVLNWGMLSGTFDNLILPTLAGTLEWDVSNLYTTGVLAVAASGLPGDFNQNGAVDAADYVLWRKGVGVATTPENYNLWRTNFGQPAGGGSEIATYSFATVPEPTSALLLIFGVVAGAIMRGRFAPVPGQRPSTGFLSSLMNARTFKLSVVIIVCARATPALAIVGYYNRSLSTGDNLVANQLIAFGGNMTLNNAFHSGVLNGTTFTKWNSATNEFLPVSVYSGASWSINYLFALGEGALVNSPAGAINVFTGNVPNYPPLGGDIWNPNYPDGRHLISHPMPNTGPISEVFADVVGRTPRDGEWVSILDESNHVEIVSTFQSGSGWDNGDPSLAVGHAAWFNLGPPATSSGDFNHNGTVDAADYVVWGKGIGIAPTQNNYDLWRENFGESFFDGEAVTNGSAGASLPQATVPEPATLVMLMFAATGWCLRRVRAA